MTHPGLNVEPADEGVVVVSLARPDRLNALDDTALRALSGAIRTLAAESQTRAIILTGQGRAFCAGGDLFDLGPRLKGAGVEGARQHMRDYHEGIRAIQAVDVPVIAAVNGACAGAGISLAAACDLVVADRSVSFTPGFTQAGIVPDLGSLYFWYEALGPRLAKELAMLGEPMSAVAAQEHGLVNHLTDDGSALVKARELAARLAAGPASALAMIKSLINAVPATELGRSLELEAFAQAAAFRTGEVDAGLIGFQTKQRPVFPDRQR